MFNYTMSRTFPIPIPLGLDIATYYSGLGKQNMDFHQTLGELIDNSISATPIDSDGELTAFRIEIIIVRDGDSVSVKVVDEGKGITIEDLENRILKLGGQGSEAGPMNEHGFGLKNAICVMTNSNTLPFKIQTRTAEAVAAGEYYVINGPFLDGISIEQEDGSTWVENCSHCTGTIGTRVTVQTTFQHLKTAYPRDVSNLNTLMDRVGEHLGVMYRGYLENPMNKMWLKWVDMGNGEWREERVPAIEIPLEDDHSSKTIDIEIGSTISAVKFVYGVVDVGKAKSRRDEKGWPYPLLLYYQHNLPTSGIDIRVRNRVVLTKQFTLLWPKKYKRVEYNYLGGELILDDNFNTVNNKTALDKNNSFWNALIEKLDETDSETGLKIYEPQPHRRELTEKILKEKLKVNIESSIPNSSAELEYPIWHGAGVKIDIHVETEDGIHIYEVKTGTVKPIDVYQLLMYWDGYVHDTGGSPTLGRLVGADAPTSVVTMIADINQRKDNINNNYNLEFKPKSHWHM